MSLKRQVLEALTRQELLAAVDQFGLQVADRRVKDQLVDALVASRKATVTDLFDGYTRDRLKEQCRALDLDDGGREKAILIDRLAGVVPSSAPETLASPAVGKTAQKAASGRGNGNGSRSSFPPMGS